MAIFSSKSSVATSTREGVLLPLGWFKGYREDLESLASQWDGKGFVVRNGTRVAILNPEYRRSLELLQTVPLHRDYQQTMGKDAAESLEELKTHMLVVDTTNQVETVSLLRNAYMDIVISTNAKKSPDFFDKIRVLVNDKPFLISRFTYEVLQASSEQSTETTPIGLLEAADSLKMKTDHAKGLLALVEDLETLVKAKIPLLAIQHLTRNAQGEYVGKKAATSQEKKKREGSAAWVALDDVFGDIGSFFSVPLWRRGGSNNTSGSGWFGSGRGNSSNSDTTMPSGGGSSGSSHSGGGFWDFLDGFDF